VLLDQLLLDDPGLFRVDAGHLDSQQPGPGDGLGHEVVVQVLLGLVDAVLVLLEPLGLADLALVVLDGQEEQALVLELVLLGDLGQGDLLGRPESLGTPGIGISLGTWTSISPTAVYRE